MMKKMQAMLTGLVLAAGLLTGSAVADEKGVGGLAAESQTFTLLEGIPAEAMSAGEMDQVEGKFVGGLGGINVRAGIDLPVRILPVWPGIDFPGWPGIDFPGWPGIDFPFPGGVLPLPNPLPYLTFGN
jgi:hypothetical protein